MEIFDEDELEEDLDFIINEFYPHLSIKMLKYVFYWLNVLEYLEYNHLTREFVLNFERSKRNGTSKSHTSINET